MKHTSQARLDASPARDWRLIGLWLVGATMAYNVAEGVIALWAGARGKSIALVGFGLDSFIECAAAAALFWRLGIESRGADPETIERSEKRVHRFIGGTFLALALYVFIQAGWTLWTKKTVEESHVGVILAWPPSSSCRLLPGESSMQQKPLGAQPSRQRPRRPLPAPISRLLSS